MHTSMLWAGILALLSLFLFNAYAAYYCGGMRSALLSSGMFALAIFTNTSGMYYTWLHAQKGVPLPDTFHSIWSTPEKSQLPNVLFGLNTLVCVLGIGSDPEFYIRIARYFFLFSVLTIIRGLVLLMTVFPYTRYVPECDTPPSNIFSTLTFILNGEFTCADYAMSGHTSISILSSVLLYIAFSQRPTFIGMLSVYTSVPLTVGTVVSLLYYRWHYTLDVYVATITATLVLIVYTATEAVSPSSFFYFRKKRARKTYLPDYLNGRSVNKK